jgi:hypothetical protein
VTGRFVLVESVFLPEAAELEGLSIYYDGGIKPEEIAEFLYAVGIITAIANN